MKYLYFLILFLFFINNLSAQRKAQREEDYYLLQTLNIPNGVELEVGGLAPLPDGRLAVSTRRGEIWMVDNPYMTGGGRPHFSLFASGLHEILGLAYKNGAFYCVQRSELTKITDTDQDGRADLFEPIYRFDISGNYHEYAYGPVFDSKGDMFVTLNVAWVGYGASLTKWHGWMLKIKPDGTMEPHAAGMRSPAGFTVNTKDEAFYAENQGDWIGSGWVTHVEKGDFTGHPAGLRWAQEPGSPVKLTRAEIDSIDRGWPMHAAAKKVQGMKTPTVWFPHTLVGISTSDILEDTTRTGFGPFKGQYFVADQGHSKIMRMTLERVKGQYQGACYPFREGFASGLLRLRWGLDGSMFGGMTSRGWSSTGKANYGLQRLVWTGETPFEMRQISAKPDGFEIEFTRPADKATLQNALNYEINHFTYKYHHHYGSPIIDQKKGLLRGIVASDDGRRVRLVVDSLREGYIYEIKLDKILGQDATPLLHNFAFYTLKNIPDGEKLALTESQKVKAQPAGHAHHGNMAHGGKKSKKAGKTAATAAKRITEMPADWGQPDEVITLSTKPGLKYSHDMLTVRAGSKIKLVFDNPDDMQHNLVITQPNAANDVGAMAMKLGLKGVGMEYVPNTPKVLFHTKVLEPGTAEVIYFTAPMEPGIYQFVCTYPGHYAAMQGVLKVVL